jgi:hypothetical protein
MFAKAESTFGQSPPVETQGVNYQPRPTQRPQTNECQLSNLFFFDIRALWSSLLDWAHICVDEVCEETKASSATGSGITAYTAGNFKESKPVISFFIALISFILAQYGAFRQVLLFNRLLMHQRASVDDLLLSGSSDVPNQHISANLPEVIARRPSASREVLVSNEGRVSPLRTNDGRGAMLAMQVLQGLNEERQEKSTRTHLAPPTGITLVSSLAPSPEPVDTPSPSPYPNAPSPSPYPDAPTLTLEVPSPHPEASSPSPDTPAEHGERHASVMDSAASKTSAADVSIPDEGMGGMNNLSYLGGLALPEAGVGQFMHIPEDVFDAVAVVIA